QTYRRRRHFTSNEYKKLWQKAKQRAKELEGIPLKTRQHWQRLLLLDYIMILANTGIRVDESKTIIWRNVDFNLRTISLEHSGKTRSSRRIVMRDSAITALQRIKERRLAFLGRSGGARSQRKGHRVAGWQSCGFIQEGIRPTAAGIWI